MAAAALQSCGSKQDNDERRTIERCEVCVDKIEGDCLRECRRLCLPDDADCDDRCTRECDQCKKDLRCQPCASGCTGTVLRCAPVDEAITCDDGVFGVGPAPSPTP